jgi:hypothetical protein
MFAFDSISLTGKRVNSQQKQLPMKQGAYLELGFEEDRLNRQEAGSRGSRHGMEIGI